MYGTFCVDVFLVLILLIYCTLLSTVIQKAGRAMLTIHTSSQPNPPIPQVLVPHPEFAIFDYSFVTKCMSYSSAATGKSAASSKATSASTEPQTVHLQLDTAILGACLLLENASRAAISVAPLEVEVPVAQHKAHKVRGKAKNVLAEEQNSSRSASSGVNDSDASAVRCTCIHCNTLDPSDITAMIENTSNSSSRKNGECTCKTCLCFLYTSSVIPSLSKAHSADKVRLFDTKRHMSEVNRVKSIIYSTQLTSAFNMLEEATRHILSKDIDILAMVAHYEQIHGKVGDLSAHRYVCMLQHWISQSLLVALYLHTYPLPHPN